MRIFNSIKQIYIGKDVLARHISLFALISIWLIFFLKYTASWGNMLVYNNFFITVPSTNYELWMYLFGGILLFFYLIGYGFKFSNQCFFDKKTLLPDFTLNPFYVFMLYLPMFLVWNSYFIIFAVLGWLLLSIVNISMLFYIYYAIMLCLIPFVVLVFVVFSKKNRYDRKFFKLGTLFYVLEKTLGDMIILFFEYILLVAIPVLMILNVFNAELWENVTELLFALKLAVLCFSAYLLQVLLLIFYRECVLLIKKRMSDLID